MMQEQAFRELLAEIRKTAAQGGGRIARARVQELLLPMSLSDGQMDLVYDYLVQNRIHVLDGEDAGEADTLREADWQEQPLEQEDADYLSMYLDDLKLLPVYTEEEQSKIREQALQGEKQAMERLIHIYLPRVVDVARLYTGQGLVLEDLIGEGNIGLAAGVEILQCLDLAEEVDGFLMKMVMDAMESAVAAQFEAAEFDNKILERVNDIHEKAKELSGELRRKVTPAELALELDMTEDEVREAVQYAGNDMPYIEAD